MERANPTSSATTASSLAPAAKRLCRFVDPEPATRPAAMASASQTAPSSTRYQPRTGMP
jgi:hypothetical protein